MRIAFFSHATQIPSFAPLARLLDSEHDVSTELWTLSGPDYRTGKRHDAFERVFDTTERFELGDIDASEHRNNLSWFRQLEEAYGEPFLQHDLGMDRNFREVSPTELKPERVPNRWDHRNAVALLRTIGEWVQKRFESVGVDCMYMESNSAPYRLAWRLAQLRDIPCTYYKGARSWPDRGYLETDMDFLWKQCRARYTEMQKGGVPEKLRRKARTRLQAIRRANAKPSYFSEHSRGGPSIVERLANLDVVGRLKRWWQSSRPTNQQNPRVLHSQAVSPVGQLIRTWDKYQSKNYYERHFHKSPELDGPFAVYFLHLQPEHTVEGMAFRYQDQVATIRNLAASLPADVPLVVKEHKPCAGIRPIGFYSELAQHPHLVLAHDELDSHDLISSAEVVLTLTGTVALESIYYGVPSLVLGNVFYNRFEGVYHPESWDDVANLLGEPSKLIGASEQDAIRTLAALYDASFPGAPPRDFEQKPDLVKRTARELVDAIRASQ